MALHMLSFENFVKSMPPSLSELKVTPSFCFAFKIPDNVAVSTNVCFIKIRSKLNSELLLCLLRIFMKQTLHTYLYGFMLNLRKKMSNGLESVGA